MYYHEATQRKGKKGKKNLKIYYLPETTLKSSYLMLFNPYNLCEVGSSIHISKVKKVKNRSVESAEGWIIN